jgi:hypothetical protein
MHIERYLTFHPRAHTCKLTTYVHTYIYIQKAGAFSKLMETYVPEEADGSSEEEDVEVELIIGANGEVHASPISPSHRKKATATTGSGVEASLLKEDSSATSKGHHHHHHHHHKERDSEVGKELGTDHAAGNLIDEEEKAVGTVGTKVDFKKKHLHTSFVVHYMYIVPPPYPENNNNNNNSNNNEKRSAHAITNMK